MANSYASAAQFFQRHDQRTMQQLSGDKNAPQGEPANVQSILDSCASMVDSTLNGRVALPLVSPPALLTDLVCDLAAYRLFGRRSDMPPAVKTAYENAQQWLTDFRKGLVTLPGVSRNLPTITQRDRVSRFDYAFGSRPSRPPTQNTALDPNGFS